MGDVIEDELHQTSNIYDTDNVNGSDSRPKLGTYIVTGSREASWTDYCLIVRMISDDANGAIGVRFRYQDADNYYRFSMYSSVGDEDSYHRLIKKFNSSAAVSFSLVSHDGHRHMQRNSTDITKSITGITNILKDMYSMHH